MTKIGILGSGRVGAALAGKLLSVGYTVTIGARDPGAAASKTTLPGASFASSIDAVRAASIVINATPGDSSLEQLKGLREVLSGKILIDVSNATVRTASGAPGGLCYPNSSLAEHLQEALSETRVVKTLNTMLFTVMVNPRSLSTPPAAFLSGNDADAKAVTRTLLHDLGWPSEWIEDLGDLTSARGVEALILLVPAIMRSRGFQPFALTIAK